ncbi:hypothetical protein, conserved [Eimeria necatrix]|uniref:Uncharacterized protein n=1 Tax=Eimeria necatrix TaxID=51315 RepID=U6N0B8_9EIME|nr:hypothetical protein, conserved [Eimeria necatrix]CDJ67395.1 hypothetical protein, conserved [Eimeria necatrix]
MEGNSVTATNVSLEAIINPIPDREPCKKENDKEIDAVKEATDSSSLIGAMASTQCGPELSAALKCSPESAVPVSTERQLEKEEQKSVALEAVLTTLLAKKSRRSSQPRMLTRSLTLKPETSTLPSGSTRKRQTPNCVRPVKLSKGAAPAKNNPGVSKGKPQENSPLSTGRSTVSTQKCKTEGGATPRKQDQGTLSSEVQGKVLEVVNRTLSTIGEKLDSQTRPGNKRRIKRTTRYEEWVGGASHSVNGANASLTDVSTQRLGLKGKRKSHSAAGGDAPNVMKRRRANAKSSCDKNAAKTPRGTSIRAPPRATKRPAFWLDLPALEAAVASAPPQPLQSTERAIARGMAAAAASLASLAPSTTAQVTKLSSKDPGGALLQAVLITAVGDVNAKSEGTEAEIQEESASTQAKSGQCSAGEEADKGEGRVPSLSIRQGEAASCLNSSASLTADCPTVAAEVGKVSQGNAEDVNAAAETNLNLLLDLVHVQPDMVRNFLLEHGRMPSERALKTPPQKANKSRPPIQNHLAEQRIQQYIREKQSTPVRKNAETRNTTHNFIEGAEAKALLKQLQMLRDELERQQQIQLTKIQENFEVEFKASLMRELAAMAVFSQTTSGMLFGDDISSATTLDQRKAEENLLFEQFQQLTLIENMEMLKTLRYHLSIRPSQQEQPNVFPAVRSSFVASRSRSSPEGRRVNKKVRFAPCSYR